MLKGAQKKMIVVKTQDSRVFEEAYFVMRTDTSASGEDMVSEANRIIERCCEKRRDRRRKTDAAVMIPICAFMGGGVIGSVITALVMLVA
ncbi:MAG: hypothetical protein IKJ24_02870 [Clostridia bacterium]|nr:hypothetical protein [Clostridia bacterium]